MTRPDSYGHSHVCPDFSCVTRVVPFSQFLWLLVGKQGLAERAGEKEVTCLSNVCSLGHSNYFLTRFSKV